MKKLLAILLVFAMLLFVGGCDSDLTHSERVKKSGTLTVGITAREPMNYKENGEWTGFDSEFAKMFAKEKLGVNVDFVELTTSERLQKLEDGEVDCLWGGVTYTDNLQSKASTSVRYVKNAQVLVMKADRVNDYNDGFEIRNLKFVVEKDSEGAFYIITRNSFKNCTEVESQQAALDMVQSGEADAAVVDYTFAKAVTAKGNKYSDLGIGFDFSSEAYCVAFSKDSDITAILNTYIKEQWETNLAQLATKYGLTLVNDQDYANCTTLWRFSYIKCQSCIFLQKTLYKFSLVKYNNNIDTAPEVKKK